MNTEKVRQEKSLRGAGRFAPSPTGPMHLGSLVAALGSYLVARQAGLDWFVRIDDLDRPRVVPGVADAMLRLLEALGFCWDGTPIWQSQRTARYAEVFASLQTRGLVYPCGCSRKEILASAPHAGEEGPVYPGTCRDGLSSQKEQCAWRVRVPDSSLSFDDGLYATQEQNLGREVGDFVLFRADGLYAYQLATVVDDMDSGVVQVVRGADLLGSTARQIYLYQCLGESPPAYLHLPLILGDDDEKISKRHGLPGVVTTAAGTKMMTLALKFLGQDPPGSLAGAGAPELLAWAMEYFSLEKILPQNRRMSEL